ncbi:MAG: fructose-6-phosphate aldolase [Armatimonadetes bacterium]|nr:fructose-6-phosphate aldolase [Armatimonadota bacterium]
MEIYLDSANLEEIKEAYSWGVISGVTTNPSLISQENRDFKEIVLNICKIVEGFISVEVISLSTREMIKEAEELASWSSKIVVKVPIIPSALKAIKILNKQGIKTNATLIFSANQAILAARAGANFVSPFLGRIDDISWDGIPLIKDMASILGYYKLPTQVIAASIRHPLHVIEAAKAGANIATIPFRVLNQMIKHPLTEIGINKFLEDWKKSSHS